jgi:8-oxo-dGTP diphosphatase
MINCHWENKPERKMSLRHVTVDAVLLNKERNQILLVKRSPLVRNPNKWVFPGGFLERGENTVKGVLRELLEETGYDGKIIGLFRVNDNPGRIGEDAQNVDFVFLIEAGEKIGKPDNESSEMKWFKFDELPVAEEFGFDHFENMELVRKYLERPFNLPIFG